MNTQRKEQIARTMAQTYEKRKAQKCRVFTCKIQSNRLTDLQRQQLKMIFVEGKWLYNAILNFGKNNNISDYDTKSLTIVHRDKDGNDIVSEYKFLPQSVRQTILAKVKDSLRVLAVRKNKGYKVGVLKFKGKLESLTFKQFGVTHKIMELNRLKLQGVKGILKLNGMDQFYGQNLDIADCKLLNKPDGYYVAFTTYTDNDKLETRPDNGRTIGIDFGCKTSFTTSEGEKINASVEETGRIRRLQRKLARQKKGSNNRYRTKKLLAIEYQKLDNRKADLANKIVAHFNEYGTIVIQDEMLTSWHRGKTSKTVQHSVLGTVKAKLIANPKVIVLPRKMPTTKLCRNCGQKNMDITPKDRIFTCACGIREDRDVHAARNMVWMYENNYQLGVGHAEITPVERTTVDDRTHVPKKRPSKKQEAAIPLGWQ